MKLSEIKAYATDTAQLAEQNPDRAGATFHESCFRCYQILEQVKEWLEDELPAKTILKLVAELEE